MAINFPSSLDNFTDPGATETLGGSTPTHSVHHKNLNDAAEALEAKVGVNSSAVTTSHDYKLANCTATAKAVADTRTVNGDAVGIEGGGALTANITLNLKDGGVTNAKLADMANSTIKGRTTAGTGDPEDMTGAQTTALLSAMVGDSGAGGVKGLAPAPGAGDAAAGKFLKADGTWVAPAGSGDVVGPASSVDNEIVRFNSTTGKLIQAGGITIADGASGTLAGTNTGDQTITLTGDVTGSGTGSFATTLATVTVAKGGTGATSLTAYAVLCGGTTTTNPVQPIASVGTSGQVLTSNGAGALPTFQAAAGGGPTYWQRTLLPESAVLDDAAPPALTIVESTGTGTPRFRVADFDATTDEILYWTFVVPSDMTAGDWLLDIYWFANATTASATCVWEAMLSATTEGDADALTEQACGTTNTASEDINTTEANRLIVTTLTITNLDSVAAGDLVTLRFNRDANNGSDDLAIDARLVSCNLKIPRA